VSSQPSARRGCGGGAAGACTHGEVDGEVSETRLQRPDGAVRQRQRGKHEGAEERGEQQADDEASSAMSRGRRRIPLNQCRLPGK
jgi:hypothetical protein